MIAVSRGVLNFKAVQVVETIGVPKVVRLNSLHHATRLRNFLLRFTKA